MTIVQYPNKALWVVIVASIINMFATGWLNQIVTIVFYIALVIWALLEITSGANSFRRGLGWTVLAYIVVRQIIRHLN